MLAQPVLATRLEYLTVGRRQHDDPAELGERDAGKHGRAHARERGGRARHAALARRHAEAVHQVRAELHRYAHRHHLRGDRVIILVKNI